MGKFDGRVAIITGGGKGGGIGYGLSTAFAKEGCNLVITGRNTKKLDDAKEELEELLVELRLRIPDKIKKYQKIISQQDTILGEAQAQADAMMEEAKKQADSLVARADEQTSEMVNEH